MIEALDLLVFSYLNGFAGKSEAVDFLILIAASFLPFVCGLIFVGTVLVSLYKSNNHGEVEGGRFSFNHEAVRILVALFCALILGYLIALFLQHTFVRVRPYDALTIYHLFSVGQWSFPSSHATALFVFVGVAHHYRRDLFALMFLLASLVGLGRIAAGVHYPTDVIAGAVLGLCVGGCVAWFIERIFRKRKEEEVSRLI